VRESLADEVEVIEETLYPYRDDVERAIFLRLKGMGKARLVRIRRRLGGSGWRSTWSGGRAGTISGILIGGMSLIPVERFRYGIAGTVMMIGS